jgi:CheY-like chemotaxis protein
LALRILARLGYQADVAANGREVLRALKRQEYDVVLMDIQMPELDGLETTRRLRRELPNIQQPRVIAMTANAMQGDRERSLAAGMDDYVSKPIRIEALVAALSKSRPMPPAESESVHHDTPDSQVDEEVIRGDGNAALQPPGADILDRAALGALLETVGGEFEYLKELIDSFLEDAPQLLAELDGYIATGDAPGVRRVAHSLKSNGNDFGASKFANLCKQLEEIGKSGDLQGAAGLAEQIAAQYQQVERALLAVLQAGQIKS